MDTHVEEGILSTVALFDGLSIGLTDFDIWYYGPFDHATYSFTQMREVIDRYVENGTLQREGPFVVFPGSTHLAKERVQGGMYAEDKYARVRRAARVLRYVPFVRMVAACNTLAFGTARKEADIDVFIVAEKNRLFIANMLSMITLHLMRLRLHGMHKTNRICLSFFVSTNGMDMSRFALSDGDPYLVQWTRALVPIFSAGDTLKRFVDENAVWLARYFNFAKYAQPVHRLVVADSKFSRIIRWIGEVVLYPIAPALDSVFSRYKKHKCERWLNTPLLQANSSVVVDRSTIKSHEEDRRAFYRDKMKSRVKEALLSRNS